MNKFSAILLGIACSALSCKKEPITPDNAGLVQLAEQRAGSTKVALLADRDQLTVGYNPIYIRVEDPAADAGNPASVTLTPVMDMGSMQHSSPVETPVYAASSGLYAGAVVFTMPSGAMGTWQLTATVNEKQVVFDVAIAEAPSGTSPVRTVVGLDGVSYTIALVQPRLPKTGMNDLEILVSKRVDMHHFVPVDGLRVDVEPTMPSMGHGSPNNVNPTGTGNGRYRGKVNFTMTGDWQLRFNLRRDGQPIATDVSLDVMF